MRTYEVITTGFKPFSFSNATCAAYAEGGDVEAAAAAGAAGGAAMPDLAEPLSFFENAFDWAKARASGGALQVERS